MVSSGFLHRVALVRTDVSEEHGASFIRVRKIGELGTTQAATSNRRKLRRNILTKATWRKNPEDTILHSLMSGSVCLSRDTITICRALYEFIKLNICAHSWHRSIHEINSDHNSFNFHAATNF
jgi:hypothetical protein